MIIVAVSMKVDLESYDVVNLTAVLDDCVDQLIVLGRIMPVANTGKQIRCFHAYRHSP